MKDFYALRPFTDRQGNEGCDAYFVLNYPVSRLILVQFSAYNEVSHCEDATPVMTRQTMRLCASEKRGFKIV